MAEVAVLITPGSEDKNRLVRHTLADTFNYEVGRQGQDHRLMFVDPSGSGDTLSGFEFVEGERQDVKVDLARLAVVHCNGVRPSEMGKDVKAALRGGLPAINRAVKDREERPGILVAKDQGIEAVTWDPELAHTKPVTRLLVANGDIAEGTRIVDGKRQWLETASCPGYNEVQAIVEAMSRAMHGSETHPASQESLALGVDVVETESQGIVVTRITHEPRRSYTADDGRSRPELALGYMTQEALAMIKQAER